MVCIEDELHARGIVLEILTGVCAGVHRPYGATIADRLLFAVAVAVAVAVAAVAAAVAVALAAEMERELIRERTPDGLRAAAAAGPTSLTSPGPDWSAASRSPRSPRTSAWAAPRCTGR